MIKTLVLLTTLVAISTHVAFAQQIAWTRHYGGTEPGDGSVGRVVLPLEEGGFVVAGTATANSGTGRSNSMVVLCADREGNPLWTRTLGEPLGITPYYIVPTSDGGCIVAGDQMVMEDTSLDNHLRPYLVRFTADGSIVWERSHYDPDQSQMNAGNRIAGFIATGDDRSLLVARGYDHHYLLALDSSGMPTKIRMLREPNEEYVAIIPARDGNFWLVHDPNGRAISYNGPTLTKVDSQGDSLAEWSLKPYSYPPEFLLAGIREIWDGGHMIAASMNWNGWGTKKYALYFWRERRYAPVGPSVSVLPFDDKYTEDLMLNSANPTSDGGFIAATQLQGTVAKIDSNAKVEWSLRGAGGWIGISGAESGPGEYLVAGYEDVGRTRRLTVVKLARATSDIGAPGQRHGLLLAPNPATGAASLTFSLERPAVVDVRLFDRLGRILSRIDPIDLGAGDHRVGLNLDGLAPGVYFCRVGIGGETSVVRTVIK